MGEDSKVTLAIQNEIVDQKKDSSQTAAGQNVEALLAAQKSRIRKELEYLVGDLREAAREKDAAVAEALKRSEEKHTEYLNHVLESQQKLHATIERLHQENVATMEQRFHKENLSETEQGLSSTTIENARQFDLIDYTLSPKEFIEQALNIHISQSSSFLRSFDL